MMKRFFVLCFLLIFPVLLFSQEKPGDKRTEKIVNIDGKNYYIYKVPKGQTLYSISKSFDVSLESLYEANPEVKEGMKAGQELKIPVKSEQKSETKSEIKIVNPVKTTEKSKPEKKPDTIAVMPSKSVHCDSVAHAQVFNVALMLPLYLNEIDSVVVAGDQEKRTSSSFKSLRFIQFYEGAMMALDSLKNLGMSVRMHVYDIDEDTIHLKKILKNPEFQHMDLIIGLLYGNSFSIAANFAKNNKIPIINPLSNKKQNIEGNPYAFLANPTVKRMAGSIAEFISDKYPDGKVLVLSSNKESEKKTLKLLLGEFSEIAKIKGRKAPAVVEVTQESSKRLSGLLSKTQDNIIVLLSNDELFVVDNIRQLVDLVDQYKLILFGMPGWPEFKSVESASLVKLNFHSFSSTFIDYDNLDVHKFLLTFREKYKTEPVDFAFQGYDIMFYFLNSLYYYGKEFIPCVTRYHPQLLQTHYVFVQDPSQGFENSWLNIFRYADYKIMDARR